MGGDKVKLDAKETALMLAALATTRGLLSDTDTTARLSALIDKVIASSVETAVETAFDKLKA